MSEKTAFTLVNPQNGNLAFKVSRFADGSQFDHVQRLGYYSVLLLTEGQAALRADFSEYFVASRALLCFSPYQPFMLAAEGEIAGVALPDCG